MRRILRTSGSRAVTRQHMVRGWHPALARVGFGDNVEHPALGGLAGSGRGIFVHNLQLMNLRLLAAFSVRGNHLSEIGVKNPASGHVYENIFLEKLRHTLPSITV